MRNELQKYINDNHLFSNDSSLLLAVSGGVDSVVLSHLLHSCHFKFSIAHCNFQLRGFESDEDETFVQTLADDLAVLCHSKRFDTEGYIHEKKISTQMAARELRYHWFEQIKQEFDYQYIVTAHHASDNIETVLYNLAKGSGLLGLTGMKPKRDAIIRPLLWAKKEEILSYAQNNGLTFREDASNNSDKYARNYIRHHIIPAFQHLNPSFENTISETINRLSEAQELLDFCVVSVSKKVCKWNEKGVEIDYTKLQTYPSVKTLLFEILKNFGFNATQVEEILTCKTHQRIGAQFQSKTHSLHIERDIFFVKELLRTEKIGERYVLNKSDKGIDSSNFHIKMAFFDGNISAIIKHNNIAQLDLESLTFPLTLRKWQQGDRFQPLGMGGKSQLLSDFFRLKKIPQFKKEEVWVLETALKEICWVVGMRIDERFKLTEQTKKYLKIEMLLKNS